MQKSRRACRHGKIRQDSQDTGRKENFKYVFCRDTARRVRRFQQREARWKRSAGTFSKSRNSKRETGRSGLVRSALEKLSLFSPTFSARQEHGAGSFAVCGQRLRGHVPSKNTSPAALSWSSLFGATVLKSFCPCTMLLVLVGTGCTMSADFTAIKPHVTARFSLILPPPRDRIKGFSCEKAGAIVDLYNKLWYNIYNHPEHRRKSARGNFGMQM